MIVVFLLSWFATEWPGLNIGVVPVAAGFNREGPRCGKRIDWTKATRHEQKQLIKAGLRGF